jgi:hypothetical protein
MNCQLNPYDAHARADSRLTIHLDAASCRCTAHSLRYVCILSFCDNRYRCSRLLRRQELPGWR